MFPSAIRLSDTKNQSSIAIVFYLILILLSACKDEGDKTDPFDPNEIPVVWHYPESSERSMLPRQNFIYKNILVQGVTEKEGFKIIGLDVSSGELVWENTEFTSPPAQPFFVVGQFDIQDNLLVLGQPDNVMVLDMETGKTQWRLAHCKDGFVSIFNNWVYTYENNGASNTVFRHHILTGKLEELFTVGPIPTKGGKSFLCTPEISNNNSYGDEILVVKNRVFTTGTLDFLAYNLTADSMQWYRDTMGQGEEYIRPLVEGNKCYFTADRKVFCLDVLTGNTIWEFEAGFFGKSTNMLLINDKVIVNPYREGIFAIDKETGKEIWNYPDPRSSNITLMREQNGVLWFSNTEHLKSLDVNTGEEVYPPWNNKSSYSWLLPVAIHPENGLIYGSNGLYLYCLNPKRF